MREPDINYQRFSSTNIPVTGEPRGCKVDRLYRLLLSTVLGRVSWYSLAKMAKVSYGWAHKLLSGLEKKGIIQHSQVVEPYRLFKIWSDHRVPIYYREYHVQMPRKTLKPINLKHAFTKYFAEQLVGDYLFPRYFDIYIQRQDYVKWHDLLSNIGYVGKGNVRVLIGDEHVFWEGRTVEGWPVVSIQQLIVDLLREGGECVEAAENLIPRFYDGP